MLFTVIVSYGGHSLLTATQQMDDLESTIKNMRGINDNLMNEM